MVRNAFNKILNFYQRCKKNDRRKFMLFWKKNLGSFSGLATSWVLSNSGLAEGVINIRVSYH